MQAILKLWEELVRFPTQPAGGRLYRSVRFGTHLRSHLLWLRSRKCINCHMLQMLKVWFWHLGDTASYRQWAECWLTGCEFMMVLTRFVALTVWWAGSSAESAACCLSRCQNRWVAALLLEVSREFQPLNVSIWSSHAGRPQRWGAEK